MELISGGGRSFILEEEKLRSVGLAGKKGIGGDGRRNGIDGEAVEDIGSGNYRIGASS